MLIDTVLLNYMYKYTGHPVTFDAKNIGIWPPEIKDNTGNKLGGDYNEIVTLWVEILPINGTQGEVEVSLKKIFI